MWEFFKRYSSAEMAKQADVQPMADLLQPLGLYKKRAEIIIRFSNEYQSMNWEYPMELHGIGKYGNDSYRIFCCGEWQNVSASKLTCIPCLKISLFYCTAGDT
jgi:methyl-CpG-binding domain protein 4